MSHAFTSQLACLAFLPVLFASDIVIFTGQKFERLLEESDTTTPIQLSIDNVALTTGDKINGKTNLVPAYQSINSLNPIESYVSDDYFGFLDDTEGEWKQGGNDKLDIGIGRLPVNTTEEANNIVQKIKLPTIDLT